MELPKGGFLGKSLTLARRVQRMHIPNHAANAGYFIVLAVFPMLVLLVSILHYTNLDAGDLVDLFSVMIPSALQDEATKLVAKTYAHTGVGVVSVSAIGALWSASKGIYGILKGMNAIYEVEEDRSYVYTRLISLFYTFAFLVVLLLTLALNVFGEYLLELFRGKNVPFLQILSKLLELRTGVMLLLQTGLFTLMYMVLPNRKNSFRNSLPGGILASLGWIVFSALFSYYVEHWAGYTGIYGSVYTVALAMLWLYFCLMILFFGGAINYLKCENVE